VVPGALPRRAAGGALKRFGLRLLVIAGVILVALCIPLPWRPPALPEEILNPAWAHAQSSGPLRVGAARVRIQLPEHPILAGYGGHHRAKEASAPVYARAIAIRAGRSPITVLIVALDTLLVPFDFEFATGEACTLVAATHTHTGPGGLWDNVFAGFLGAGQPDEGQRAAASRAFQEAIAQAKAALAPAEMQVARESWTEGPARARSDGPIDPDLVALRFRKPGGATVATVVVYAMHPTSAARDVLSADWPGQLEGDAPTLVLQGAVGNTTWPRGTSLAAPIADEVETLLRNAPAVSEAPLECTQKGVMPRPQASRRVPWILRGAFGNLLTLAGPSLLAYVTRLRIGSLELLGVPGEPVGELGIAARPTVLVGLSGGYLGYVETPERWEAGTGESAKTYFGPGLAHALGLWPR